MNIIELAKQAGLHIATDVNWMPIISLEYAEKFADLVAAQEREATELTKLLADSYDQGVKDGLETVLQLIKELRPAIMPLENMGCGKDTQAWFDILVEGIKEVKK